MVLITDVAASYINDCLQSRGAGEGIRVKVVTSGCSGLSIKLEYVDKGFADDIISEHNGARVFIDPKSLVYIDDSTIDIKVEGLNKGLVVVNPKSKDECGCGQSFNI